MSGHLYTVGLPDRRTRQQQEFHAVILRDGALVGELSLYGIPFPSEVARQFCDLLGECESDVVMGDGA